ncbi:MAG: cyclic pyranopterin monophosphate synthase MoaC [Elusimicrobia bacterium]|nr:cyclic pyranopterin monophosphate synthase MoaC [Elusimicrobiota bacterium]
MVDTTFKKPSTRSATAEGFISMSPESVRMIRDNTVPKGDVLGLAKTAGLIAVKSTPLLLPMCHNIQITHCDIGFGVEDSGVKVDVSVRAVDRTGTEMEAMTALSVVLLNIYDMLKAVDKSMTIRDIRLLKKSGGKSGEYVRQDS